MIVSGGPARFGSMAGVWRRRESNPRFVPGAKKIFAAVIAAVAIAAPSSAQAVSPGQIDYSNWYVMTYRCGHVAGPWYYGGWNPFYCLQYTGYFTEGSYHVYTYFNEATDWLQIASCYVGTSWYGSFHEFTSGC